jgi:hypothetical protein
MWEREYNMGHSSPNQALEPTPSSVRCAPAFRRGSPRALGAAPIRVMEAESTGRRSWCRPDQHLEGRFPCVTNELKV